MKGIVFNLLETCVVNDFGQAAWESMLDAVDSDTSYTSLGTYDDAEFLALVGEGSKLTNTPVPDLVQWFGVKSFPLLAAKYPQFLTPHKSTKEFLLTLNDVIHPEVRKLYPEADVPDFKYKDETDDQLVLVYWSKRKFCLFGIGLIESAAKYYGDKVTISQRCCMNKGDDTCEIVCKFS